MSIVLNLDRDTLVKLPVTEKTTDLDGQALPAPPAWSAALFPHSGVWGGGRPHAASWGLEGRSVCYDPDLDPRHPPRSCMKEAGLGAEATGQRPPACGAGPEQTRTLEP